MVQDYEKDEQGCGIGIWPVSALLAGAFHGYCDGQGILMTPRLEDMLTYGPSVLTGATASFFWGLEGSVAGGAVRGVLQAGLGGTLGLLVGAVATGVGYAAGYSAGKVFR